MAIRIRREAPGTPTRTRHRRTRRPDHPRVQTREPWLTIPAGHQGVGLR